MKKLTLLVGKNRRSEPHNSRGPSTPSIKKQSLEGHEYE
jgi:hypothetical protein